MGVWNDQIIKHAVNLVNYSKINAHIATPIKYRMQQKNYFKTDFEAMFDHSYKIYHNSHFFTCLLFAESRRRGGPERKFISKKEFFSL
jgi:hypothetical protein